MKLEWLVARGLNVPRDWLRPSENQEDNPWSEFFTWTSSRSTITGSYHGI